MRAALRHHDTADHASAPRALLSVASVHRELDLKLARRAIGASIVAKRGTAGGDGTRQRALRGFQYDGRVPGGALTGGQRMHACEMQCFVDINVAESRDDVLVEQQ